MISGPALAAFGDYREIVLVSPRPGFAIRYGVVTSRVSAVARLLGVGLCATALCGIASCTSTTGGTEASDPPASGSAKKGPAAGFSASLSDQLKSGTASTDNKAAKGAKGDRDATPEATTAVELPIPGAGPSRPPATRRKVKPPAAVAAIKFDLEPNWERDLDTPGTISFVLNVPNSTDTRLFGFAYGYDFADAPADQDTYRKYLAERKVMNVTLDRQRGAAWYLEGTDGTGVPVFRTVVLYGGKRLVCGGSLYKDKASTALGADLRDKVVAAAKKICETLTL